VESGLVLFFLQASGFMPVPERPAFPWRPVLGVAGILGPSTTAISQRGIVADWTDWSKRKVCEDVHRGSHSLHSFSTSTIFVQAPRQLHFCQAIIEKFTRVSRNLHRFKAIPP